MIVESEHFNKPVLDMSLREIVQLQADLAAAVCEAVAHGRNVHLEIPAVFRRDGRDSAGSIRFLIPGV